MVAVDGQNILLILRILDKQADRQSKKERGGREREGESICTLFLCSTKWGEWCSASNHELFTVGPEWMTGTRTKVSSSSWELNCWSCSPHVFLFLNDQVLAFSFLEHGFTKKLNKVETNIFYMYRILYSVWINYNYSKCKGKVHLITGHGGQDG